MNIKMAQLGCGCQNALLIASLSVFLKTLLFPSYSSTDFEVHRNWLAITHQLPHELWYSEDTSEWTLDYPPLFAWFEWILSQFAVFCDPEMILLLNLNYKSWKTIYFQRGTVVVTEFLLLYATYKCSKTLSKHIPASNKHGRCETADSGFIFMCLIAFNFGLLIVDHIHFQYNGILFGILFLSLSNLMEGEVLWGSFWFAVLLNAKHIFLYVAPAYGVYLLRTYCMNKQKYGLDCIRSFNLKKFFLLAFVVTTVFTLSFRPFFSQLLQVISRLFPFKRGLTHAYWAPNFWALYNFGDKVLGFVCKQCQWLSPEHSSSLTSGLVQNVEHAILPNVSPFVTFLLTFCAMLPCLLELLLHPCSSAFGSIKQFLYSIVICSLSSFIFGWHVHEKAILMAILPLTFLSLLGNKDDAKIFLILQAVGHYSLFPLLFTGFETVTKLCLILMYSIFAFCSFGHIFQGNLKNPSCFPTLPLLNVLESIYIYGLAFLEIFSLIQPFSYLRNFAYLPLMLTSVYCAIGIMWCWLLLYKHMLFPRSEIMSCKESTRKVG